MYFDTDSIIYLLKPGDTPLPLGTELGQFTDEIEPVIHPDFPEEEPRQRYVSAFVSGGPKNYCLELSFKNRDNSLPTLAEKKVSDFKTVIRGFSLSKETRQNINFSMMKNIVEKSMQLAAIAEDMEEDKLDDLLERQGLDMSASGIANPINAPIVERFSISIGDKRPIRGIKRKRKTQTIHSSDSEMDSEGDEMTIDYNEREVERSGDVMLGLFPTTMKRKYAAVVTKRVPDLTGEMLQNYLYPFGYVKED